VGRQIRAFQISSKTGLNECVYWWLFGTLTEYDENESLIFLSGKCGVRHGHVVKISNMKDVGHKCFTQQK
jgi:hypothetical protein